MHSQSRNDIRTDEKPKSSTLFCHAPNHNNITSTHVINTSRRGTTITTDVLLSKGNWKQKNKKNKDMDMTMQQQSLLDACTSIVTHCLQYQPQQYYKCRVVVDDDNNHNNATNHHHHRDMTDHSSSNIVVSTLHISTYCT